MSENNIHIVQLSDYTTPEVTEEKNRDWIGYGEDNDYFEHLISLSNSSPTNNAIINGMVDIIYGGGLDAKDKARKPDEYAMMMSIFKRDDVYRVVADLKLMGNASMQVIYSKDKSRIIRVEHFPVETLRATKADEDGKVEKYVYSPDWSKVKKSTELDFIPAFGCGSKNELIEVLYIKPYKSGFFYYSPVDYQGCLPYCEMEGEISNYHINNIRNGFSPSFLINFNNGVPDERTQSTIERQITQKYGGTSNAGRAIIAFNDDKEQAATIDAVQLSDADKQYQFIADESMRKIMLGHRITSPMLLGIKDNSGLGNNAEELKTASLLFEDTVINPFRILLLDSFERVMAYNGASLDMYFESLSSFVEKGSSVDSMGTSIADVSYNGAQISSAIDIVAKVQEGILTEEQAIVFLIQFLQMSPEAAQGMFTNDVDIEKVAEDTSVTMSKDDIDINDDDLNQAGDWLIEQGEDLDDEWEEVDAKGVGGDDEGLDQLNELLSDLEAKYNKESLWSQLARAVYGKPTKTSEQDTSLFKVRYRYAKPKVGDTSREFCKKMVGASKVYRKEDIEAAGDQKVNAGFGKGGADSYSIWLYKGGARCHHYWERVVYLRKSNKKLTINEARRQINKLDPSERKDAKWEKNDKKVATRPVDMPNEGFVKKQ